MNKKILFLIFYIFIFLLLVWQGVFWAGEYKKLEEYNETMEKIGQEMSFRDWAKFYSFNNMLVVGTILKYKIYRDYVAVVSSQGEEYISWEEWKKEYKQTREDAFNLIKEQVELVEADDFGGNTPEETWEMFLDALRDGDMELASKYFVPRRREEHFEWFKQVQEAGMLEDMIRDLTVSGLDLVSDGEIMVEYIVGVVGGDATAVPIFRKNLKNKWKIESI